MAKLNLSIIESLDKSNTQSIVTIEPGFHQDFEGPGNIELRNNFKKKFSCAIKTNDSIDNLVLVNPTDEIIQMVINGFDRKPVLPHLTLQGTLTQQAAQALCDALDAIDTINKKLLIRLCCTMDDSVAKTLANGFRASQAFQGFLFGQGLSLSNIERLLLNELEYQTLGIIKGLDEKILENVSIQELLSKQENNITNCYTIGDFSRPATRHFFATMPGSITLHISGDACKKETKKYIADRPPKTLCFFDDSVPAVCYQLARHFATYAKYKDKPTIIFKHVGNPSIITQAFVGIEKANKTHHISGAGLYAHNSAVFQEFFNQLAQHKSISNIALGPTTSTKQLDYFVQELNHSALSHITQLSLSHGLAVDLNTYLFNQRETLSILTEQTYPTNREELFSPPHKKQETNIIHTLKEMFWSRNNKNQPEKVRPSEEPLPNNVIAPEFAGIDYPPKGKKFILIDATPDGSCAYHSIAIKLGLLIKHGYMDKYQNTDAMKTLLQRFADFHPNFAPKNWDNLKKWITTYSRTEGNWKGTNSELEYLIAPVLRYWFILHNHPQSILTNDGDDFTPQSKQLALNKLAETYYIQAYDIEPEWLAKALGIGLYMGIMRNNKIDREFSFLKVEPENNHPFYVAHLVHTTPFKEKLLDRCEGGHYMVYIEEDLLKKEPKSFKADKDRANNSMLYHFIQDTDDIFACRFVFPTPDDLCENFKIFQGRGITEKSWSNLKFKQSGVDFSDFLNNLPQPGKEKIYWAFSNLEQRTALIELYYKFTVFYAGSKNSEPHKIFLDTCLKHPQIIEKNLNKYQIWYNLFHNSPTEELKTLKETLIEDISSWLKLPYIENKKYKNFEPWFRRTYSKHKDPVTLWTNYSLQIRELIKDEYIRWTALAPDVRKVIRLLITPPQSSSFSFYFLNSYDSVKRATAISVATEMAQVDVRFAEWAQLYFKAMQKFPLTANEFKQKNIETIFDFWVDLQKNELLLNELKEQFHGWNQLEKNQTQWLLKKWNAPSSASIRQQYPSVIDYFFAEKQQLESEYQRENKSINTLTYFAKKAQGASITEKTLSFPCANITKASETNYKTQLKIQASESENVPMLIDFKDFDKTIDALSLCLPKNTNNILIIGGTWTEDAAFALLAHLGQTCSTTRLHIEDTLEKSILNLLLNAMKPNGALQIAHGAIEEPSHKQVNYR